MAHKLFLSLALCASPALADPALFVYLHPKQAVRLVLPDGTCDAKVVHREPDQLTARLKKATRLCGTQGALVIVVRNDVRDVVDRRPPRPEPNRCALLGMALVGLPAARYLGSDAVSSQTGALAVLAASGIAAGLLCRDHTPRYVVLTDRITPAQF